MELGKDTPYGTRILPHLYRVAWWDCAGPDVVNGDVYAVDCGISVTPIDSGRGDQSFLFLRRNLEHWGLWNRLRVCLLTHLHKDHAGGVGELQALGVSVWCGRMAARFVERREAQEYFENRVPAIDSTENSLKLCAELQDTAPSGSFVCDRLEFIVPDQDFRFQRVDTFFLGTGSRKSEKPQPVYTECERN
jgi:glyoxylase-like metal-dependent hydrolase (beta-lactamase superfamily II)